VLGDTDIAIIIPVFKEQDTIAKVLRDIDQSLIEPAIVYIIADFETDPTISVAKNASVSLAVQVCFLIQDGTFGPASAIKLGIESSKEKYIVFMTADDSDDATDIPLLVSNLRKGNTVVCASRYAKDGKHIGGPKVKYFLSWLAGQIVRYVTRLNICDPTNLFKAVTREFLDEISIESKYGFTIGLELVGKANTLSRSVIEIPTVWHERTVGASSFQTLKWIPTYTYWFLRLIFSK
jgi:dolichol-phosphate mannosyltransferase